MWAAKGKRGAAALEDGGVVFGGREYGLCPGYPNPSETEMIDTGQDAVIYGVVNYPGLAKVQISTGQINSFAVGTILPAPHVEVVDGVSFYIGTLPRPACSYHFFEVNTTSPSYSAEHNIGFGGDGVSEGYKITNNPGNDGPCVTGKLDPLSYSEGIWHLPPGQFDARNGGGGGGGGGGGQRRATDRQSVSVADAASGLPPVPQNTPGNARALSHIREGIVGGQGQGMPSEIPAAAAHVAVGRHTESVDPRDLRCPSGEAASATAARAWTVLVRCGLREIHPGRAEAPRDYV